MLFDDSQTKPLERSVRLETETGVSVSIQNSVLIGRHPEPDELGLAGAAVLDLAARDPEVSRNHAFVAVVGDHIRVFDLQSTNGTRIVRGGTSEAVTSSDGHRIEVGDLLAIGASSISLVFW